jgi:hypothetical protein
MLEVIRARGLALNLFGIADSGDFDEILAEVTEDQSVVLCVLSGSNPCSRFTFPSWDPRNRAKVRRIWMATGCGIARNSALA